MAVLSSATVHLDAAAQLVRVRDGAAVPLARRPVEVLGLLMRRAPDLVSVGQVGEQVWGAGPAAGAADVRHHVLHLRALIEVDLRRPRVILTTRGVGYRFAEAVTVGGHVDDVADQGGGGYAARDGLLAQDGTPGVRLAVVALGPELLAEPPRSVGELLVQPAAVCVRLRGQPLPGLPLRLFALLHALAGHPGQLVTWPELERWWAAQSNAVPAATAGGPAGGSVPPGGRSPVHSTRKAVTALGARLHQAGAPGYLRMVAGHGVVLTDGSAR